jgi:putative sigma-54 modulation protein
MAEKTKSEVKEKFSNAEYPVHIIGRHLSITDAMKTYAVDKLARIERFGGRVIDITIIMDVQKLIHEVDFIIDVNNTKIRVSGRSENMYASIDEAIASLENKLRRYMGRLKEHHAKKISDIDVNVNVIQGILPLDDINDQIEEVNLQKIEADLKPHQIVSREKKPLKLLNQEEAIMKMELSEDKFMVYINEADQKIKVIYRRNDGNYGIIEPEK